MPRGRLVVWPWVLTLAGCGREVGPDARTVSPPPTVTQPSSPPPDVASPSEPEPVSRGCGPGLEGFACERAAWCSGRTIDATTAIDGVALLCVMDRVSSTVDGHLRMGDALASMPFRFRHDFVLKHGREVNGARGHAFERMVDLVSPALAAQSQSATPRRPRVIMWDEQTGLSIAFNAGVPGMHGEPVTGGDRLDIHTYDRATATFGMFALDLPVSRGEDRRWMIRPFVPDEPDDDCTTCHGPHRRPIWPMYPDWPTFYGSDNDELTQPIPLQRTEAADIRAFRDLVDAGHPAGDPRRRYASLFAPQMQAGLDAWFTHVDTSDVRAYLAQRARTDERRPVPARLSASAREVIHGTDDELQRWLGLEVHATFPFRPDHAEGITEPSRAFFHRPNLRLGVLYNRLLALHVAARLEETELYRRHRGFVLASLMACGRLSPRTLAADRREEFVSAARAAGTELPSDVRAGLPLMHLMRALGWRTRDLDIRFTHANPRYDPFDVVTASEDPRASSPMDLGRLPYGAGDFNADTREPDYFNSYWDGSATFDELLVARLLPGLGEEAQSLYRLHSLTAKYGHVASRMALDAPFFADMDGLSGWFPLPFPKSLLEVHHRQSFVRRVGGVAPFREQHRRVCRHLDTLPQQGVVEGERPTFEGPTGDRRVE